MFFSLLKIKNIRFGILVYLLAIGYLLPAVPLHAGTFSKPPTNLGLVAHWSFNEGTSTIAHDFSGNGKNGTLTNMDANTDWVAGKRGGALDFDGVNDEVVMSGTSGLTLNGNVYTVSAWFYVDPTIVLNEPGIIYFGDGTDGLRIGYSNTSGKEKFFTQTSGTNQYDPTTTGILWNGVPNKGVWVHVANVFDYVNDTNTFYFNGIPQTSAGTTAVNGITTNSIVLGRRAGSTNWFKGKLDDVRIYNRALSSSEINTLMNANSTVRKAVSNRGLVGHWSLDEGTSTIAHDFSGNSIHGTLTNMTPHTDWAGGKRGKALDFDGTDDFIALGNPSALNVVGQVTVSAWVNFSSFPTSNNCGGYYCGVIFEKGYDGSVEGYSLRYSSSGGSRLEILSYSGVITNNTIASITFPVNTWHHVVGLHNGTQWKLYVDGVNVATTNDNDGALSSTANASIGGAYISGTPSRFFPGKIDDVRVYSRALSDSEVQALYNQNQTAINSSQQNRFTDGLVGYWSFNGSDISWANNIAYDRSGRNSNAVITSMSTTTSPVPGKSGQALRFDAVDDIVNAGSASSLDDLIPMSVSFWIKPNSAGEGNQSRVVAKNGNIGVAGQWQITLVTGAGCLAGEASLTNAIYFIKVGSTATARAGRCGASNSFTIGEWQHFMVTWDGSTGYNNSGSRIYRNGVEISYHTVVAGATDSAGSDASLDLVIGNRADTARTFDGAIDEVRVYNRVLSVDEAKQLYRLGR